MVCQVDNDNVEVTRILIENSADPAFQSHKGMTPLHIAASKASPALIELLLKAGGDGIASLVSKNGRTALHCLTDSPELRKDSETDPALAVRLLLQAGCPCSAMDNTGKTALEQLQTTKPNSRINGIADLLVGAQVKNDVCSMAWCSMHAWRRC